LGGGACACHAPDGVSEVLSLDEGGECVSGDDGPTVFTKDHVGTLRLGDLEDTAHGGGAEVKAKDDISEVIHNGYSRGTGNLSGGRGGLRRFCEENGELEVALVFDFKGVAEAVEEFVDLASLLSGIVAVLEQGCQAVDNDVDFGRALVLLVMETDEVVLVDPVEDDIHQLFSGSDGAIKFQLWGDDMEAGDAFECRMLEKEVGCAVKIGGRRIRGDEPTEFGSEGPLKTDDVALEANVEDEDLGCVACRGRGEKGADQGQGEGCLAGAWGPGDVDGGALLKAGRSLGIGLLLIEELFEADKGRKDEAWS
jgi:hypothetical protein